MRTCAVPVGKPTCVLRWTPSAPCPDLTPQSTLRQLTQNPPAHPPGYYTQQGGGCSPDQQQLCGEAPGEQPTVPTREEEVWEGYWASVNEPPPSLMPDHYWTRVKQGRPGPCAKYWARRPPCRRPNGLWPAAGLVEYPLNRIPQLCVLVGHWVIAVVPLVSVRSQAAPSWQLLLKAPREPSRPLCVVLFQAPRARTSALFWFFANRMCRGGVRLRLGVHRPTRATSRARSQRRLVGSYTGGGGRDYQ